MSVSRPKPFIKKTNSRLKCSPVNVHIFVNSQERGVSTDLTGVSKHTVYLGVKLEDDTSSSANTKLNSDVVFFRGTNDVARNEGMKLVTSLSRKLRAHRESNIAVLSVPH